jgi:hypothetical protein
MGPDHPECPDRLDAVSDGMIAAGLDAHVAHYDALPYMMQTTSR